MIWPSRGNPQLYQRGKLYIVRWYNPVEKRVRVYRTRHKHYAEVFMRNL